MKKIIATLLIICAAIGLCACGNMSMGFGTYDFSHVHFSDNLEGHCASVEVWYDDSTGIEVLTKEHGSIFLSEGTYILFSTAEQCPYCN